MNSKYAIIGAVVVLLAGLYTCATWAFGRATEQNVMALVAKLPASMNVRDRHYHPGWYTSELDLTFTLPSDQLKGLPIGNEKSSIKLHAVIHQGPVCGLTCFGWERIDFSLRQPDRPPLSGSAVEGFLGGKTITFSTPPMRDVDIGSNEYLTTDGNTIEVRLSGANELREMHWLAPHVMIRSTDGTEVEASSLRIDASWQPAQAGYESWQGRLSIASLSVAHLNVPEIHLSLALHHLQRQALAALSSQMRQTGMAVSNAAARDTLQALLLHNPELTLDAGVTTQGGKLQVGGSVRAPGITLADLASESSVMQKLQVRVDSSVDDGALTGLPELPGMLQVLGQEGYVTRQSHGWHTVIELAYGRATANGKDLRSLPGVVGPTTQGP